MSESPVKTALGWSESAGPERAAGALLAPAFAWFFVWMSPRPIAAMLYRFGVFSEDTHFALSLLPELVVLLLLVVWALLQRRAEFVLLTRPRPRAVELCLFLGIVSTLVLRGVSGWAHSSGIVDWPPMREYFGNLGLFAFLMAPAIGAELLFRGLLLQRFRQVFSLGGALALQAGLFALGSTSGVMLHSFVFGVVLGLLRVTAGSLWPCLLMVAAWNGVIAWGVWQA
jgi:membrane protease YdiL (CAAX protease family)